MGFRLRFLSLLGGILLFATTGFAQFGSSIQGTVVDQSGAVIPGARVLLTDQATGIERQTETSAAGVYRFPSLGAGEYEVRVEADGFTAMVIPVDLLTNQIGEANAQLDVQAAAERVVVTAQAPVLDTADSRLQSTIEEEALDDLPFGSRNMLGLAAVAPGITGYGLLAGGSATGPPDNFNTEVAIEASGNGRNSSGNLYTLDGLNMTSNIIQGRPNVTPNVESVEEVSIQTNTFSVEQTNASSVQIAITTKSGSNEFHGTGSWFFTNQQLTARSVFSPGEKQKFKKNILNGTIGGPVVKNSTFFFASYEGLRSQQSLADSVRTFESREFLGWAQQRFPNTLGTQILAERPPENAIISGASRTAEDVFGRGESGCESEATRFIPCSLPMINEGRFVSSPFRNGNQYNGRVDQYLNDSADRLYFNFYKMKYDIETQVNRRGFSTTDDGNMNAFQGSWTHTFSPTVLNEFSFGWGYVDGWRGFNESTDGGPIPVDIPNISVQGQSLGISPAWGPAVFIQNNFNWRNVVTVLKGSHSLKFGVSGWWGDDDARFNDTYGRVALGFNNLVDLVTDRPFTQNGPRIDPLTGVEGPGGYEHLLNTWGFFVQDEWKVTQRLTLTYGIRWDDFGNITRNQEKGVPLGNLFLPQQFSSLNSVDDINAAFAQARVEFTDDGIYAGRVTNNISPRAGFAWDPSGNGSWTIRGGFGMYHDWIPLGEANRVRGNPPGLIALSARRDDPNSPDPIFSRATQLEFPYGWALPQFSVLQLDERGGLLGARGGVGAIDRNIRSNDTYNYNIGVETRLAGDMVAGAMYSGSQTRKGLLGSDFNRFAGDLLDGNLDRLNPSFGSIFYEWNGNSIDYNAMILSLRGRFGSRGSFQTSYTFSKTEDFGQAGSRVNRDPGFATPSQHGLERFKGPADWDFRNRFSFAGLYELGSPQGMGAFGKHVLGGWQLSSITILQSGPPYNVWSNARFQPATDAAGNVIGFLPTSGDFNADGVAFDFPNAASSNLPSSPSRAQFLSGLFSRSDFPLPAPGSLGNFQRHSLRGPGMINVDFSVVKNNQLTETVNLQLRFEFFNVLNRVNLRNVNGNMASSTFGRVTSTFPARQIQLGARLAF